MDVLLRQVTRKDRVKLGRRWVQVKPLTLENALALIVLLAPHLARIEEHWPQFKAALETTDGSRPQVLSAIFSALRDELATMPGDMIRAMAFLVDRDAVELAGEISAREFVEALPVLDRVNDLAGLYAAVRALGLTARYRDGTGSSD